MLGDPSLSALAVVAGMSLVTYATKAGGFWALDRFEPSQTLRDGLDALPEGILVAILVVRLLEGGPAEWVAGVVVLGVAHRTESVLLAMVVGVGSLLVVRASGVFG